VINLFRISLICAFNYDRLVISQAIYAWRCCLLKPEESYEIVIIVKEQSSSKESIIFAKSIYIEVSRKYHEMDHINYIIRHRDRSGLLFVSKVIYILSSTFQYQCHSNVIITCLFQSVRYDMFITQPVKNVDKYKFQIYS